MNTSVTALAAVLAAVAGATVLSTSAYRMVAGFIALGAAGLSAMATSIGASDRSKRLFDAASVNLQLEDHAKDFCVTKARFVSLTWPIRPSEILRRKALTLS